MRSVRGGVAGGPATGGGVDAEHTQFQGEVAVITAGTQGLDELMARFFAQRGAAGLVLCGRQAGFEITE